MKQAISLMMMALAGGAFALTMPDGFVYRGRCVPATSGGGAPDTINVTLRLYETETAVAPSWTGTFNNVPLVTNGLFQIWVSQAAHEATAQGEAGLERVLQEGRGSWLGVSFGTGRECRPRRMLVTAPLANAAAVSAKLDSDATVDVLRDCETLVSEQATVATLTCDTLALSGVSSSSLGLSELNVLSATLLRDGDNQILSRLRGAWSKPTDLEPGMAITNRLGKAAFLTIRSEGSCSAPLLTVPVPSGAAFVWQAAAAKCCWRFVALGAE